MLFSDNLPSDTAGIDIGKSIDQYIECCSEDFIRRFAPTIREDGHAIQWMGGMVAGQVRHPITDEMTIQPGYILALWIGPTSETDGGKVLGISPVAENIWALAVQDEVGHFFGQCLSALDEQYKLARDQFTGE